MPKKGEGTFYPKKEGEVLGFFTNAVTRLVALATKYGIDAATITALQTHYTNMQVAYNQAVADATAAQNSTGIKHTVFAEGRDELMLVFKQIQLLPNFDENDAELIGFRVITDPVDLRTVKPVITGVTVKYGMVIIDWKRGSMQGVIIYSSYDGKKFTEIGRDLRSPFEDVRPNLVEGQPDERHYRLAYMKDDKPIGIPSEISKVIVDTSVV